MRDGGPQILQAGQEWKALTSILADVGLLGFAIAGATAPAATARALSSVIRPIGEPVIASAAAIIGKA
jgi:hypothetical protein